MLVCTSFDHWLPVRFLFIIKLANMALTLIMLRKIPFLPPLQTVYICHWDMTLNVPTLNESLWLTSEERGEKEKLPLFLTDSATFLQALT